VVESSLPQELSCSPCETPDSIGDKLRSGLLARGCCTAPNELICRLRASIACSAREYSADASASAKRFRCSASLSLADSLDRSGLLDAVRRLLTGLLLFTGEGDRERDREFDRERADAM
jgi:hypothetical protein